MPVERITINELDQSQSRLALSDVFNVLVVLNDNIAPEELDGVLYEDRSKLLKKYGENLGIVKAVANLIDVGLGVYITRMSNVEKYKDLYQYDISFIVVFDETASNFTKIDALISARNDCTFLVPDYSEDEAGSKNVAKDNNKSNPTYKAVHSPAVYVDKDTKVPGAYAFLKNFGESLSNGNPSWFAIAGVNRGNVNYLYSLDRAISQEEANTCQDKDQVALSNYNPIMYLNNTYGNIIYGQRTLSLQNSSLRSLNVRIMSNMIKKRIFNICLGLLFEVNDLTLWNEFRGQLVPYLSDIRFNRGISDFEVIMTQEVQNPDDPMSVKGYVRIYPTRSAEYFDIDFILAKNNTTVKEEE